MSKYTMTTNYLAFKDAEFIKQEGRHGDEGDFEPRFTDYACPPGRISRFTSPPTYRMRLVTGDYWRDSRFGYTRMGPSTDLINQYKSLLAQGKVIAEGTGHEPFRWNYKWPESAALSAQSKERNGLPMDPFLNLLLKSEAERPSNLRECIDYFYPLSGSIPPDADISPFISTSIAAYYVPDADPDKTGNLPLRLGEVSMMYGWYLAWKMILCPNEYKDQVDIFTSTATRSPDFPFQKVGGDILLDVRERARIDESARNDIETLANISSAIGAISALAQSAAASGVGIPESLEEVRALAAEHLGIKNPENFVEEIMHRYGTAYVASILNKYVEIPYTHLNDLASVVVNGAMSADKWNSLLEDAGSSVSSATQRAARAAKQLAERYVTDRLTAIAGDTVSYEDLVSINSLFTSLMVTGVPSESLTRRVNDLRRKPANQRTALENAILRAFDVKSQEVEYRSQRILKDFASYGNARPNPEPISMTVIGISLAGKLIQGGLSYHAAKKAAGKSGADKYLTDNLYRLNTYLQSGEASFDLSRHIRTGYWTDRGVFEGNGWYNSATRPDCMLQQGGQVLDYWIHVWSRVQSIIVRFEDDRKKWYDKRFVEGLDKQQFGTFHYAKYFRKDVYRRGYPAYGYSEDGNRPRKETYGREERNVSKGYSQCQGLGILAKHTDSSMRMVLDNMQLFSPFTHAYGFAPTAQLRTDGRMFINGVAPRRFLGPSNFVYKRSDGQVRPAAAPGRIYPSQQIDRNNAYGPHGVECWAGTAPLPSRRLLESVYGQRCNLSFDVGLDPHMPVMNAQFAGLMACLLSHPEALKTCYQMGLPWAKNIVRIRTINLSFLASSRFSPVLAQRAMMFAPRRQIQLSPHVVKILTSPQTTNFLNRINISKAAVDAINSLQSTKRTTPVKAQSAEMSTGQKVVAGSIAAAVGGALSFVAYKIYRSGDE